MKRWEIWEVDIWGWTESRFVKGDWGHRWIATLVAIWTEPESNRYRYVVREKGWKQ